MPYAYTAHFEVIAGFLAEDPKNFSRRTSLGGCSRKLQQYFLKGVVLSSTWSWSQKLLGADRQTSPFAARNELACQVVESFGLYRAISI